MADTPKLTAEEQATRLLRLVDSGVNDGQHVSATVGDIRAYAASLRAKAFEEAAEMAKEEASMATRTPWIWACQTLERKFRARAKERSDARS